MKLKLILTTAVVGGALALPSASSAAPPPPPAPKLDTATATGSVGSIGSVDSTFNIQVDAHSGPSGENPGGFASFDKFVQIQYMGHPFDVDFRASGPVTCLNVTGNAAVIKIDATAEGFGITLPLGVVEIDLVDNGGSGSDLFGLDCASLVFFPYRLFGRDRLCYAVGRSRCGIRREALADYQGAVHERWLEADWLQEPGAVHRVCQPRPVDSPGCRSSRFGREAAISLRMEGRGFLQRRSW